MKILYVVSRPLQINTSASLRNIAMINGLVEIGNEVTVVTSEIDVMHPNFDDSIQSTAQKNIFLKANNINNITKIGRNSILLQPLRRSLYKLRMSNNIYGDFTTFGNKSYQTFNLKLQDFDCIISSSDPKSSHLFCYNLLELNNESNIPWIQIWGDPFMADITRKKKNDVTVYKEEFKLLSKADKVVYVSPLTLESQKSLFPECKNKMTFIPIPYLSEKIFESNDVDTKRLRFLYAGDYNSSIRNLEPVLDYFTHQKNTKHVIEIIGVGDIEREGLKNIVFNGRQSYETVKCFEEKSDVLIFIANKRGNQIPGKIYQYSGTNKPILFINDGEKKEFIMQYFEGKKRYIFCDNTSESIENAITELSRLINEGQKFYPVEDFSPSNIAHKILRDFMEEKE